MEIKSFFLTRKVSVDNIVKLLKINQQLEKELKELNKTEQKELNELKKNEQKEFKELRKTKQLELPYPCDKCSFAFRSAGTLVKHVQDHHEKLPKSRP